MANYLIRDITGTGEISQNTTQVGRICLTPQSPKLRAIPEIPLRATNVGDVGDPNVGEFGDSNVVDQSDIGVEQNFPLLGELLEFGDFIRFDD